MSGPLTSPPAGIDGSDLRGPFAVGMYAAKLRGWLRERVSAAAGAHAAACVEQTGARAALLGSIAAGLRGHEAALA